MSLTFMTCDSLMKYRHYRRNLILIAQQIRCQPLDLYNGITLDIIMVSPIKQKWKILTR